MNEKTLPGATFRERISHTADSVAYRRTFTSIPYSKEIFTALERIEGPLDPKEKAKADAYPAIIPLFESRYILTDMILRESGIQQVLELASGLSPRGFVLAENPSVQYVEMDLLDKIRLKDMIITVLHWMKGTDYYSNHHLMKGDVTNVRDFEDARRLFDGRPICVICEGLLRYMSWPDKAMMASLIRDVISTGGIWITPDIELLSSANATPQSRERYDKTAKEWGIDVRPNLFHDMDHAVEFFKQAGFKVEKRSYVETFDRLTSPHCLGLNNEEVRDYLSKWFTFVLSV